LWSVCGDLRGQLVWTEAIERIEYCGGGEFRRFQKLHGDWATNKKYGVGELVGGGDLSVEVSVHAYGVVCSTPIHIRESD